MLRRRRLRGGADYPIDHPGANPDSWLAFAHQSLSTHYLDSGLQVNWMRSLEPTGCTVPETDTFREPLGQILSESESDMGHWRNRRRRQASYQSGLRFGGLRP